MWGERQLHAAQAYGVVKDIPFPTIDEKGDEQYVSALAETYVTRISEFTRNYAVTVHLMGELTFTFALLKRLQAQNIPCIAATSKRMVAQETCGKKLEVTFEFERFRKYE
jgi:hypothetical protein